MISWEDVELLNKKNKELRKAKDVVEQKRNSVTFQKNQILEKLEKELPGELWKYPIIVDGYLKVNLKIKGRLTPEKLKKICQVNDLKLVDMRHSIPIGDKTVYKLRYKQDKI